MFIVEHVHVVVEALRIGQALRGGFAIPRVEPVAAGVAGGQGAIEDHTCSQLMNGMHVLGFA